MSTLGDIMSTSEGAQYIGRYHDYIGGCSVYRGDVMMHMGKQGDKAFQFILKTRCTHDIPQCTHDIPQCTHDIPQCTELPLMYL